MLAASAALLAAFLVIESRAEEPVLPLSIFRLRTLAGANAARLLLGASFYGFVFVGTLYMQEVLHYSALDIGKVFLAAGSISIVMMPLIGRIGSKVDGRILLAIGVSVVAASQYVASELTAQAAELFQ